MASPAPAAPRVRALSMHAGYACARSGACCRAGWTIPVDVATRAAIEAHLAAGRITPPHPGAPPFTGFDPDDPAHVAFSHDEAGACTFLAADDSSLCAIHRDVGEAALPVACRQFPRVAVIGDTFAGLTLSHACPTAAARLVDWAAPLSVVRDPACAHDRVLEGLDTRGHLPPLLRPGVLHALDSWERVETAAIALFDGPGSPWRHLQTFDAWMRRLETWTLDRGPLESFTAVVVAGAHEDVPVKGEPASDARTGRGDAALADWRVAWAAVPPERATPPNAALTAADVDVVVSGGAWDALVGRYLAAKVVGSWVPWLASRSVTLAHALRVAGHVLIVEAARRRHQPDREAMIAAVREADVLLIHLADTPALVRSLEAESAMPRSPF